MKKAIIVICIGLIVISCNSKENNGTFGKSENGVSSIEKEEKAKAEQSFSDYLTSTTFSLNGNGRVSFSAPYGRNNKGQVRISGGRADLVGTYTVNESSKSISISGLAARSGSFDASNNNGSSGYFSSRLDGSLQGRLSSGGQSRDIKFVPYP